MNTLSDLRILNTFVDVAEGIIFAHPLPTQIIYDYETIKKRSYHQIGLECNTSKIWKLQREAINQLYISRQDKSTQVASQGTEQLKLQELQQSTNIIRLELLKRIDSSFHLIASHQNYIKSASASLNHILQQAKLVLSSNNNSREKQLTSPSPINPPYDLDIYKLEEIHAEDMIRYKELEQFYHDNFIDLKNNFSQIEERILLVIEHLNKEMIENQTVIFNLQQKHKDSEIFQTEANKELQIKLEQAYDQMLKNKQEIESHYNRQMETIRFDNSKIQNDLQNQIDSLIRQNDDLHFQIKRLENDKDQSSRMMSQNQQIIREEMEQNIYQLKQQFNQEKKQLVDQHNEFIDQIQKRLHENEAISTTREQNLIEKLNTQEQEFRQQTFQIKQELQSYTQKYHKLQNQTNQWQDDLDFYIEFVRGISNLINPLSIQYLNTSITDDPKTLYTCIESLSQYIQKLQNDNNWLADRLAEFGRENEWLKQSKHNLTPSPVQDRLRDFRGTSSALREFGEARTKLLNKFYETR